MQAEVECENDHRDHDGGRGQVSHRQLQGSGKQVPQPKGEPAQQGKQVADGPHRQNGGEVVGDIKDGVPGSGCGHPPGSLQADGEQRQHSGGNEGGGDAHLQISQKRRPQPAVGVGLVPTQAFDHGEVKRGGGGADSDDGDGEKDPQNGQQDGVHDLVAADKEGIVSPEEGVEVHSAPSRTIVPIV